MSIKAKKAEAYICVKNADAALDFYRKAFGASETGARILMPDGRLGHGEFLMGETLFMISDEYPEMNIVSPQTLGGTPVAFTVHVDDADAAYAQALAAGATALRPLADQFYGDRSGQVMDPFGFRWTISQRIEDVSPEEQQRRAKALFG